MRRVPRARYSSDRLAVSRKSPPASVSSTVRPTRENKGWPKNGIDHFILQRLDEEGLAPSPEADRHTLLRRLSFDLRGLPPTPEEVRVFVSDESPEAYAKLVDRFLASPAYGERMAVSWLDLVRYAETKGAQGFVVSPPRVPGLGYRSQYRHFDRIARTMAVFQ